MVYVIVMISWHEKSEKNISTVDHFLQRIFYDASDLIKVDHLVSWDGNIVCSEGVRTMERQRKLYDSGRSHISVKSRHLADPLTGKSKAFDFLWMNDFMWMDRMQQKPSYSDIGGLYAGLNAIIRAYVNLKNTNASFPKIRLGANWNSDSSKWDENTNSYDLVSEYIRQRLSERRKPFVDMYHVEILKE